MKVDSETLEAWETGVEEPSYANLEKLAYNHFKIPLAIFFFPNPPEIEEPVTKFRRLPTFELARFSPDTFLKLRLGLAYQDSLEGLFGSPVASHLIFQELDPNRMNPSTLARKARSMVGIELADQYKWRSAERALKVWRHAIEEVGVFTFKDSFEDRFISGFCLLHDKFPIILINNSNSFTRQIFTLAHELGHILYGINGVTDIQEEYIDMMDRNNKLLEIKCNQFAAEFLVPSDAFIEDIPLFERLGMEGVSKIADKYSVSREVILRRLLSLDLVSNEEYEGQRAIWNADYLRRGNELKGGNYYLTKLAYLGEGFAKRAIQKYKQGQLDKIALARHFNMNSRNISKLESTLRW
jgi:Zn-dependent peptidase ImmA (M78 family)